ncbi:TPA: hypothetical protein RFW42_001623 [Klebsiella pneumoniae subsp. pneumoniae]|nr:hypothetical protein [Klebsiella pneumoniae subsp. pneumoniae]HDU3721727.1 hypothetical protein [Klebsiella pneumoniae subsp. pneumoniae]HDU3737794.1 hypothetical protein [Klebsiella pneumoniae subsp. pneumoniae]HDU5901318.1 hypothetical protein [Klebsiella pneumoniae subsp. pneumoniae]
MDGEKLQTNVFNREHITKYFTEHTNKSPCQECGNEDFSLEIIDINSSTDPNDIAVSGVSLKGLPDLGGIYRIGINHIRLVCPNCGYTKLYDAFIINKKIAELYGNHDK